MGANGQGQGHQAEGKPLLPDEVTLKVFSYLTRGELVKRAAPVCRQWRRLSYDHELWREVMLDWWDFMCIIEDGRVTVSRARQQLVRQLELHEGRMIHVKRLELYGWEFMEPEDDKIIDVLHAVAPGVTSLHLTAVGITGEETLKRMIQLYSRQLTHISIERCSFPPGSLHIMDLMCDAPHLTSIILSGNWKKQRWSPPGSLKHSWPNLNEVCISDTPSEAEELLLLSSVAGQQIKKLTGDFETLQVFLTEAEFPQVEYLHIRLSSDVSDDRALDGLRYLENLHHLTLTGPPFQTCLVTTRLFSWPSVTRGLETFTLAYDKNCDDACLMSMGKCTSLSKLAFVECTKITHDGLHGLVLMLPKIKSVGVQWCPGVDQTLAVAQFKRSRPDVVLLM